MRTVLWALLKRKFTVLAVLAAITVTTTSTALAGTGVGGVFNLGVTNTVNAITKLVGSVAGASLQITNNSTHPDATALSLNVKAGHDPLRVSSTSKVERLNADNLDGIDSTAFGRLDFTNAEAFTSILSGDGLKDLASVTITNPGNQSQLVEVTGNFMVWDFNNPECPCEVDYFLREQGDSTSFDNVGFVVVGPTGLSGGPGTLTTVFTAAPGTHTYTLSMRSFSNSSDALIIDYARMTAKTIPFTGAGATPTSAPSTTTSTMHSVTGRASDR
jgi:hypothetical protein